jgi:HK97 family phage major capsid protein
MNYKQEMIKRAYDGNALTSLAAAGTVINPNIWDTQIRDFLEAKLVVQPLCEVFDFRSPGVDYKVTIDETPAVASAVSEASNLTVVAFATRNVTFTPSEVGVAYQVTQKELNRAFFNVMDRMTKKIGYSLALARDTDAISTAQTAASNTVIANGVAAVSSLASTDTLGYEEVIEAARKIENYNYTPVDMVINNYQKAQLLSLDKVNKANEFGTRDAVAKGLVGELFGIRIYVSPQITAVTTAGSYAKALMLGVTGSGEKAVGFAIKQDPMLKTDYDVLGRYHTLAAHEEYDFVALHPKAICTIATYSA